MAHYLFLSPHLDDVILSCGGMLYNLVQENATITIVTIFAGCPDFNKPFSDFARFQHEAWRTHNNPYRIRRNEDKDAFALYGLKPVWLDFLDCIYRGDANTWYYNDNEEIFHHIHQNETHFADTILAMLEKHVTIDDDTIVYSPVGLGHHVDHQLTVNVAIQLMEKCKQVYFYQDYPYVEKLPNNHILQSLMQLRNLSWEYQTWFNKVVTFSEEGLATKIKSIARYSSQISMLFGDNETMKNNVSSFSRQIGQGQPAERFWFLKK